MAVRKLRFDPVQILTVPSVNTSAAFASGIITGTIGYLFANIVIKQDNNYDIGFSWNGFEYQLVADIQFWQQPWSIELFLDRVNQRYAYNSILESTSNQGFHTVNETVQEDGSIKLTLQKWNSHVA